MSGPAVSEWVGMRMGGKFSPDTSTAIGLQKDGHIIAGVVYENWNGKSIVAHMASAGRLTRLFLWAIFDYAFRKCGVNKVILPIDSGNAKSVRFVEHLGFHEEARISDAAKQGDVVLYTMSKDECRFLGEQYGKA